MKNEFTHFTWMDKEQYRRGLAKLEKKLGLSEAQIKIVVLSEAQMKMKTKTFK